MSSVMIVDGELYDKCASYAETCASAKKRGSTFNVGCINDEDDPCRAQRIGKLGEAAFGMLFGVEPDFAYRRWGDKLDFLVGKKCRVDVKTTAKRSAKRFLIRVKDDRGRTIRVHVTRFVGCRLLRESRDDHAATIEVVGYIDWDTIKDRAPEEAFGGHWNIAVEFDELVRMKHDRGDNVESVR